MLFFLMYLIPYMLVMVLEYNMSIKNNTSFNTRAKTKKSQRHTKLTACTFVILLISVALGWKSLWSSCNMFFLSLHVLFRQNCNRLSHFVLTQLSQSGVWELPLWLLVHPEVRWAVCCLKKKRKCINWDVLSMSGLQVSRSQISHWDLQLKFNLHTSYYNISIIV